MLQRQQNVKENGSVKEKQVRETTKFKCRWWLKRKQQKLSPLKSILLKIVEIYIQNAECLKGQIENVNKKGPIEFKCHVIKANVLTIVQK